MLLYMDIKILLLTIILVIIIDFTYLSLNKKWYIDQFGDLFNNDIKIMPAILCWIVIGLGLYYFVLNKNYTSSIDVFKNGLIFGLISYLIYNLTNYATIKGYKQDLIGYDSLWGGLLCGIVAVIMYKLIQKYNI